MSESYTLESVSYMPTQDILLVKFHEIESLHIVDNVSLSIRVVKQATLAREEIWHTIEVHPDGIRLDAIDAELTASQLYDLIYKRKAGVSHSAKRLI